MLHTPIRDAGSSRYCGPTAMAAITGKRGSEVRDAIRLARGGTRTAAGRHMPITFMVWPDVIAAMSNLGWAMIDEHQGVRYRFCDFLREHGDSGAYIVHVARHYIAVSHGELCDSAVSPLPREITDYLRRTSGGYRNSWVKRWCRFQTTEG